MFVTEAILLTGGGGVVAVVVVVFIYRFFPSFLVPTGWVGGRPLFIFHISSPRVIICRKSAIHCVLPGTGIY